jgi:hypothetical protein
LIEHLYASLARPFAERDSRSEFVMVPVEGAIIEAREAAEW